jgi:hypothetical protein
MELFFRLAAVSLAFSAASLCAEDLARYRDYRLERELPEILKQLGKTARDVRMVHQRPALIQELRWQASSAPPASGSVETVKEIQFSFYNGVLYRMVVVYDRNRTQGLNTEDMIAALSGAYGTASKSAAELVFPTMYNETVGVLARWENAESCVNLVQSGYHPTYGLVLFSRRVDALAQADVLRAVALDDQEAPLREKRRQKSEAEATRLELEKAREANKGSFRP